MKMKTVPFAQFMQNRLRRFSIGLPIGLAVLLSVTSGVVLLLSGAKRDRELVKMNAPYMATLVESGDRTELQRLVGTLATEQRRISIIDQGVVMATSAGVGELDRSYVRPAIAEFPFGISVSDGFLFSEIPIQRLVGPTEASAQVIVLTPLAPLLSATLLVALAVLIMGGIISKIVSDQVTHGISVALNPVSRLRDAITGLKDLSEQGSIEACGIEELDSISNTVQQTRLALVQANRQLAEARAKELATDAYRGLIHDLHNPAVALKNLSKALKVQSLTEEERRETTSMIEETVDEFFQQINSAKRHLSEDPLLFKDSNLVVGVESAADRAVIASDRRGEVQVQKEFPVQAVYFSHDNTQLRRAVGNLVSNALDACRSVVRIGVSSASLAGATQVSIFVEDDGQGISQERAGAFLQGKAKSDKPSGTGLGLATANHIVRGHGGRIIVTRSELGGARFEIRMGATQ